MAHSGTYTGPVDLSAAEIEAAREMLDDGQSYKVALPGRGVVVCTSVAEVKAAQRGRIPPDAVRLDRGARR